MRKLLLMLLSIAAVLVGTLNAMPPNPSLLESNDSAALRAPVLLPDNQEWHQRGICQPDSFLTRYLRKQNAAANGGINRAPGSAGFKILALLVKFSDKNSSVSATFYDSLLFNANGNTVNSYFNEISYGQIDLITVNLPTAIGWRTAPSTYAYYVGTSYGTGTYPQNSQRLAEDMINLTDSLVDFSNYDNDGDGWVDCLLIIHTGTGAELSGSTADMWSHKWGLKTSLNRDGVWLSSYTVQPEYWYVSGDMTPGVYAHELSHGFGLPDLYDTDNSSYGLGKWCIMAYGSWNGPGGLGGSPAHPCAWSREQMGIITPTNVTSNQTGVTILPVEAGGAVYRMWTSGAASNEYFLVENRLKTGFDTYLPASGLMIWHIDDGKSSNQQEWYPTQPGKVDANHYWVALEQADGLYQIEKKTNSGDAGDPYPGSAANTSFTAISSPSSDAYQSGGTLVSVQNIVAAGPVITADLMVNVSAGVDDTNTTLPASIRLAQNYPNPFNPSTHIEFSVPVTGQATLEIYNIIGEKVKTLVNGPVAEGTMSLVWDGTNDFLQPVASGIYLYRLTAAGMESVKKMALIR